MATLDLVTQPNKRLHNASTDLPIAKLAEFKPLGEDMIETMLVNNGIGLAAVQIGKNINLFTINKEVSGDAEHWVLCNPTISFTSKAMNVMEEGCLSCPKIFGDVKRPEKIRVKAYTLDGELKTFKVKGLLAKVFQHEIDHLRGTIIMDKFEQS